MKKNLLCTSAIALGVVAAPAVAQEWDLAVHGYFNQHLGYTHNRLHGNGFDNLALQNQFGDWSDNGNYDEGVVYTNAEIHFTPSITLDNGLTFGANVQLEGTNQSGSRDGRHNSYIDESYIEIKGDRFGKLILGSENSAGYKSMVAAPTVTSMYINSPSVSAFVPFSAAYQGGFRQGGLSSYTEVDGNNDTQRITYFTPSFNGFVLGFSYAPNGSYKANKGAYNSFILNRKDNLNDVFDVGASYNQSWGEFDVSFGARYGTASRGKNLNGKDPDTWGVGAQFGYAGFTFGGAYASNNSGHQDNRGDSSGWSLGATYDMGPWGFEAVTYQGRAKSNVGVGTYTDPTTLGNYATGDKDKGKYQAYRIGVSRDIGPGVDWDVYGVYVKANNGGKSGNGTLRKVKGYGVGTAINLSF